jgi:hypothetical protein
MTDEEFMKKVQRLATIQATVDILTEEAEDIKAEIADHIGQPGTKNIGNVKVTLKAGQRRVDPERFEMVWPRESHPELYKSVPDTEAARKRFGEAGMAKVVKPEGKRSVVLG